MEEYIHGKKELLAENLATFFAKKRASSERFCDNWKEEFYKFINGLWQQRDSIRSKNDIEKYKREPNIIPEPIYPLYVEEYLNDKWDNLYPIYKNMEKVGQDVWTKKQWSSSSGSLSPKALTDYKDLILKALNNENPKEKGGGKRKRRTKKRKRKRTKRRKRKRTKKRKKRTKRKSRRRKK